MKVGIGSNQPINYLITSFSHVNIIMNIIKLTCDRKKGLVSKNFNVPLKIKTKISHKSDLQYNRILKYRKKVKTLKKLNDSLNSGI